MPTFTGYNPWVGKGTVESPYDIGMPISWQWRAKRILAGLTCYNPITGIAGGSEISGVPTGDVFSINASGNRSYQTGSGIIYEMQVPEIIAATVRPMTEMPRVEGSPADFRAFCVSEVDSITTRFTAYRPDLDWEGDATGAAVTVLDELVGGNAEAQRLWSHYRDVLSPSMPTPECPTELLTVVSSTVTKANIARCNQIAALPDNLANQVRRAELAYRLFVYSECVSAIPENL